MDGAKGKRERDRFKEKDLEREKEERGREIIKNKCNEYSSKIQIQIVI